MVIVVELELCSEEEEEELCLLEEPFELFSDEGDVSVDELELDDKNEKGKLSD